MGVLTLELIDKSRANNLLTPGLDSGVTFLNPQPYRGWVSYVFSVINGVGFNRADDNDAKDVVGKLEITPPGFRGCRR